MLKKILYFVLSFLLLLAIVSSVFLKKIPSGGEIYASDFDEGYLLYLESIKIDTVSKEIISNIYQINDNNVSSELLKICSSINCYREIEAAKDIMLAGTQLQEELRLYFLTSNYCYKIIPINWENYSSVSWSQYPIKQERADKPTLKVWRIDLFDVAAEDFLSYAQNFQGQDSLNSEGGIGWYSILSTDLYSKLLELMASLNNSSMIVAR